MSFRFSWKIRYNVFPQDSGVYSSLVAPAFGFVALDSNPESCLFQGGGLTVFRGYALIIRIQISYIS